jgi:hypothetical protein
MLIERSDETLDTYLCGTWFECQQCHSVSNFSSFSAFPDEFPDGITFMQPMNASFQILTHYAFP